MKDKQSLNLQINQICFWELILKVLSKQTVLQAIQSHRILWPRLTKRLMSSRSCCCCSTLRIGSGSRLWKRVWERCYMEQDRINWMIQITIRRSLMNFKHQLPSNLAELKTKVRLLRIVWIKMTLKTSTSHEFKHLLHLLRHFHVMRFSSRIPQINKYQRST